LNNTIVGDFPSSAYAYRIATKDENPLNQNITFYNNIWSDPTGTMGSGLSELDNDFSAGNPSSVTGFVLSNNLYWNGGVAIPAGDVGTPTKTDKRRVVANPRLNTNQKQMVLPRWNGAAFLSGNTSIRQEFIRLARRYGKIPIGSAAIDKANPAYAPATDILRRARGTSPDLGAFEFIAMAATSSAPFTPTNPSGGADLIFADGLESRAFSSYLVAFTAVVRAELMFATGVFQIRVRALNDSRKRLARHTVQGRTSPS
jgi:hypothetical protein